MGVNVRDYKAKAFLVSSMYAGLAGVLYALSIGSVAPDSFGLALSVQFLAMIVLGGLGSVAGSILGATFVSALPLVFQQYAGSLPFIVDPGRARHRGQPGGRLPVRRGDRPRRALRARRTRRPRAPPAAPPVHPVLLRRTRRVPIWTRHHAGASRLVNRRKQMMKKNTKRGAVTLVSVAMVLAASGCSTKASDSASSTQDGVKVGRGIDGTTIHARALTDLTGVFAALGKDITNAQALYWKNQNAATRSAASTPWSETVKDHGYDTQQGIQLYSSIHNDVLAIEQTIGSPINTGLLPQFDADHMVNIPAAWAQSLTEDPQIAVVGATYEVEMINVLDYLLKEGKIKEGDKIGHIYFEGEYGEGGLAGSKYFAEQHGMQVVEQQIQSTDTDMTAQVTKLKAEGVKAIALTVAPGQTASVAGVAASQGLDVPIVGNNPVFAPGPARRARPARR